MHLQTHTHFEDSSRTKNRSLVKAQFGEFNSNSKVPIVSVYQTNQSTTYSKDLLQVESLTKIHNKTH